MSLSEEIEAARRTVKTDSLAMSVGELVSMYEERELNISPAFQRLYRWETHQKAKFIESILLGIPIPPIFVFETDSAKWELIDGLQRISTILEFMGRLKDDQNRRRPPLSLQSTVYLPSLANAVWEKSELIRALNYDDQIEIGKPFQFEFRRSRLDIQILKRSSDEYSKYDLFQRLNSGGTLADPQEVRNCALIMVSPGFFELLTECADSPQFRRVSRITESGRRIQKHLEYVTRFFVFTKYDYEGSYDVEEFIDKMALELARYPHVAAEVHGLFRFTFDLLYDAYGTNALRKKDGNRFTGQVGLVALEGIAVGIARNARAIQELQDPVGFVRQRIEHFWAEPQVRQFGASGVSGTRRLAETIPFGQRFFRP
jgi:hypothetical protein